MLAVGNLLRDLHEDLSKEETGYKDTNDDYDFRDVLEACGSNTAQQHKIKHSDGREKSYSFGD